MAGNMESARVGHMSDDWRAILTEREILLNEGNGVTEKYYSVVVARVRNKIELLADDLAALEALGTALDNM